MKKYLFFSFLLFVSEIIQSQDLPIPAELFFNNYSTTRDLHILIYPISFIFNEDHKYEIKASNPQTPSTSGLYYTYNNGVYVSDNQKQTYIVVLKNHSQGLNFDGYDGGENAGCIGSLTDGRYKAIISWSAVPPPEGEDDFGQWDSLVIEYDCSPEPEGDYCINFRDDIIGGGPRLTFCACVGSGSWPEWPITDLNKKINIWKPYGDNPPSGWTNNRNKCYGDDFTYYNGTSGANPFPLDARRDCPAIGYAIQQNHSFSDIRSGDLTLNMKILWPGAFTPVHDERLDFPTYFNILSDGFTGPTLTIDNSATLELRTDSWYSGTNNKYSILNNYSRINLISNASIIVGNHNKFNLYFGSNLNISQNALVWIEPGGSFCNYGGRISGQGHSNIFFEGGINRCSGQQDFIANDSVSIILDTNAIWELADSSIITLDSLSSITMYLNSTIKFGQHSKLILKHGSKLIANNCTFTCLDSGHVWAGIFIEDASQDTIKNCIIENADSGITVTDNYNSQSASGYNTEISGCTFKNSTNTELTDGIHVSNSGTVLIRNNTFTSTILTQGWTNAITAEYCYTPFIIADNTISNTLTCISITECSPFIGRNTINGLSSTGTGILLDNSNGTVEHNTLNYSEYSLSAQYSSPYILQNIFYYPYKAAVNIKNSSVPVMAQVISGGTSYALGGDNNFRGTPSEGAIRFTDDAYPTMYLGINNVQLTSGFCLYGDLPASLSGNLSAEYNYWGTSSPGDGLFNVSNGSVTYNPYKSSATHYNYTSYELNDIGFGLYDTVFTKNLSSPVEVLFMQAYHQEQEANYLNAITLYKQVITLYKESNYAHISLSRIFNCAEKRRYTSSEYTVLHTYLSSIRTNTLLPAQLREQAEDYIIKSKVRRGNLDDAISDYNQMYLSNQNNPKGLHALRNKNVLIRMRDHQNGMQPGQSSVFLNQNTGNLNAPTVYKLYQNYPNPFNPSTTIKYDLPKAGDVKITIFDITGRQVLSVSYYRNAGSDVFTFDGTPYASGLYFYKVESGGFVESKKMLLIK